MRACRTLFGLAALVVSQSFSVAHGDFIMELPTNSPTFQSDASYGPVVTNTDPTFSQLPQIPGIRGIKMSGSATYQSFYTGPSIDGPDTTLSLYATGPAHDGLYLWEAFYIDYNVNFTQSSPIDFRFILEAVFHFVDINGQASSSSNLLDLGLVASTTSLSGQLAVPLYENGSNLGTGYEMYVAIIFDERKMRLGDTFRFDIPPNSIDVGVNPQPVPEPGALSMFLIGGLLAIFSFSWHRRVARNRIGE
jgi:hypothetical protein